MQPYFFPYAQQFRHIGQCDHWIIFDTPKFSRKSWVSRNRILNRDTEWGYVAVPVVKGASNDAICEAEILQNDWRNELKDKLRVYEKAAPFFDETMGLIEVCLNEPTRTIADLNTAIIQETCQHLGIETELHRLSELDIRLPETAGPGEWACLISKEVGANIYSNAPGGRDLFDPTYYSENGVELEFYEPIPLEYSTPGFVPVEGLSVIDPLMWMGRIALGEWRRSTVTL
nr:WbqC family protein [Roseibium polysiphoniae]